MGLISNFHPEEVQRPHPAGGKAAPVMGYRADIDGLRAVAVLSVVLYHLGVPGITGGFVGVDVFFVISGFLIARIIHREIVAGTFTLADFYERRARRILPALFVVVLLTIVGAHFLLPPFEYDGFGLSAAATMGFAANFHFKDAIDYFTTAAEFHPLLHTWSLAVEEQFYLFFPLVLIVLKKLRLPRLGILLLLVASFAASAILTATMPKIAFYMLPFRAWELLIGAVLALEIVPRIRSRYGREVLGISGLALILAAVLFFDKRLFFPGYVAALPVVGAAMVIHAGEGATSLAGRLLSTPPAVFVGVISYSLYLWHWPILALLRQYRAGVTLCAGEMAAAFAASLVGASLSWWLVERPFRHRRFLDRRAVFALAGAGMAGLSAIGLGIHFTGGMPGRLSPEIQTLVDGTRDWEPRRRACANPDGIDRLCDLGPAEAPKTTLLWGDSHAGALMGAVEVALAGRGEGVRLATTDACPPLLGVRLLFPTARAHTCPFFNEDLVTWLEKGDHGIRRVVLAARWALAATGHGVPGEDPTPVRLARLDGSTPAGLDEAESDRLLFAEGLEASVRRLSAAGLEVVILGNVPEIGWDVPRALVQAAWRHRDPPSGPSRETADSRSSIADAVIEEIAARHGANVVPIAPILCQPDCRIVEAGHPLYVDDGHLSTYATRRIVGPALAEAFARLP